MESIPVARVLERLRAENPWWDPPHHIGQPFADYAKPRAYLDLFLPLLEARSPRRAVVLLGPRRVGKTVMIHHAITRLLGDGTPARNVAYVSVDHPLYTGRDLDQIVDLVSECSGVDYRQQPCVLFLDEIQYLREWERYLKALVDRHPGLRCVVSGSAAAALRVKSLESGAGRFTDFLLPPLTFSEYLSLTGSSVDVASDTREAIDALNREFVHYINFGGYPEVALLPEVQANPERFIKSDIIDKVLLRDLPSLYGIQNVRELNALLTTLSFNTAAEVSLESICQHSGVAKNTIKRYLEYLQAAFLVQVVHRVDRQAKRFQRAREFKVYLTTPSMHSALFAPVGADDDAMGRLVETAVYAQWFHLPGLPLSYARWPHGEVDIVGIAPDQRPVLALEVKWSDRFLDRPDELSSLVTFCRRHSLREGIVTTRSVAGTRVLGDVTLRFTPVAKLCHQVGAIVLAVKSIAAGEIAERLLSVRGH